MKVKNNKKILRFFPYYGGKGRMVTQLLKIAPPHKIYVDPFVGSGALLLNKPRSEVEIVNDLDIGIYKLFSVVSDKQKGKEFIEEIQSVGLDKEIFELAKVEAKNNFQGNNDLETAVLKFIQITASFDSTGKSYAKGKFSDVEQYRNRIGKNLPKICERLQGTDVLNVNAFDVIEAFIDQPDAFIFIDPPYLKELRGKNAGNVYSHEMSNMQHDKLLRLIRRAKARIILCGYKNENENDYYDEMLLPFGWSSFCIGEYNRPDEMKEERKKGKEFVWVNYEIPEDVIQNLCQSI